MITFNPDLMDVAKKVGALVDDIYIDPSNEYTLSLSDDEYAYLKELKAFYKEAEQCDTVKK